MRRRKFMAIAGMATAAVSVPIVAMAKAPVEVPIETILRFPVIFNDQSVRYVLATFPFINDLSQGRTEEEARRILKSEMPSAVFVERR